MTRLYQSGNRNSSRRGRACALDCDRAPVREIQAHPPPRRAVKSVNQRIGGRERCATSARARVDRAKPPTAGRAIATPTVIESTQTRSSPRGRRRAVTRFRRRMASRSNATARRVEPSVRPTSNRCPSSDTRTRGADVEWRTDRSFGNTPRIASRKVGRPDVVLGDTLVEQQRGAVGRHRIPIEWRREPIDRSRVESRNDRPWRRTRVERRRDVATPLPFRMSIQTASVDVAHVLRRRRRHARVFVTRPIEREPHALTSPVARRTTIQFDDGIASIPSNDSHRLATRMLSLGTPSSPLT